MNLPDDLIGKLFLQLSGLGITPQDKLSIRGSHGLFYIRATRGGQAIEQRLQFDRGTNGFVPFDPAALTVEEKKSLARALYKTREFTQSEIAMLFNMCQGSICGYLKYR